MHCEAADPNRTAFYWGRGSLRLRQGEAIAYHHLGQREKAVTALQSLISTMGESTAFQIASAYAQWGDAEFKAFLAKMNFEGSTT